MIANPFTRNPNGVSAYLPPDARESLTRAALEAKRMTTEAAREAHLEAAIARVRSQHPTYFK